ncbi:flavin containing amine oxidoreductase [Fragilaria crotonensis]|nr:flavin containing amine oxidoreductase [Fragilaria crotonensis]
MRYFAIGVTAVATFFWTLLLEIKPTAAAFSPVPKIHNHWGTSSSSTTSCDILLPKSAASTLSRSLKNQQHTTTTHPAIRRRTNPSTTKLYGIRDLFRNRFGGGSSSNQEPASNDNDAEQPPLIITAPPSVDKKVPQASNTNAKRIGKQQQTLTEKASICIIGGGVSGLMAAITAATESSEQDDGTSIVLLEASPTFGGRVQSDVTDDGYVLDRGFAVFIDEYPSSKALLDYKQLQLGKFIPGAMVKLPPGKGNDATNGMAKVADPLRQPLELFTALTAPVGSLMDKIKVLPLLFHVFTTDVAELFQEEETTTLQALKDRWGFSDEMIDTFYKPFLEGIYLAPLDEQSSRMFSFIFKMFSQGSATLPMDGIGAVSKQLAERAKTAGVVLQSNYPVGYVSVLRDDDEANDDSGDGRFVVESMDGTRRVIAKSVIVATDVSVAEALLSQVGVDSTEPQPQRSVGCLYYSFDGDAPIQEPILILSGLGNDRGTEKFPINNLCFPSIVNPSYAPPGKSLCSVTVLKPAMELYEGREADLDLAVRRQLKTWFPDYNTRAWRLLQMYSIPNAQPAQLGGPVAANANGGRDCQAFRGTVLPAGMFVCGDHMATATLNGALESGINAGKAAVAAIATK